LTTLDKKQTLKAMADEPTTKQTRAIHLGDQLQREFARDAARPVIDREARTVELSFASDTDAVERYYGGGFVREILDHEHVDFSRLNDNGPLLLNHDRNQHIGAVSGARVETNGDGLMVSRTVAKITRNAEGDRILNDLEDGIVGRTSTGYELLKELERGELDDGSKFVRFSWRPFEVSFTPIPADQATGAGRAGKPKEKTTKETERETPTMSEKETPPAAAPEPKVEVRNEPTPEQRKELIVKGTADEGNCRRTGTRRRDP
jgi:HK97 family phage prohead protease